MITQLDPYAADVSPPTMYGCTRDQVHKRRMVALRRFLSALACYARGKRSAAAHHLIACKGALRRAEYEAEMCAREEERTEFKSGGEGMHYLQDDETICGAAPWETGGEWTTDKERVTCLECLVKVKVR